MITREICGKRLQLDQIKPMEILSAFVPWVKFMLKNVIKCGKNIIQLMGKAVPESVQRVVFVQEYENSVRKTTNFEKERN